MTSLPKLERTIGWFSHGAASAVACKLALEKFDNVELVYQCTGSEHEDNPRFKAACEEWYGQEIKVIRSDKYKDIWDVFEKTRWLIGPSGARCTGELKRKVAERYINFFRDREVFGYTADEAKRVRDFKTNNPERIIHTPLIDSGLTKDDCYRIVTDAGITLPTMYTLGFNNNNCLGCVKGGQAYWNHIRRHFPEVFDRMAKQERELNVAINKTYAGDGKRKRLFLDEMSPTAGGNKMKSMSCGILCGADKK